MKKDTIDISRETFHSLVAQFSLSVIAFITLILLSRKLGPEAFGVYAVLLATGEVIQSTIGGFGEGIKKRASEQTTNLTQLFSLAITSHLAFISAASIFVMTFATVTSIISPMNGVAITLYMLGSGFFTVISSFNSGIGYPAQSYKYRTIKTAVIFSLQVPLVYLGANPNELLIAAGFAWGITALALAIKRRHSFERPTKDTIKSVTRFAKWSIPNKLLFSTNERLPYFIIGLIATSSLVGYYEVALKLLTPALLIPYTIGNTLSIHVSHKTESNETINTELKNALSIATCLGFPLFVGATLLPENIITLVYSNVYKPASVLLPLLSIVVILQSLIIIYQAALRGQDNPRAVSLISLIRVILKGVFIIIGFHYLSLVGVAIALIIADAITLSFYVTTQNTFANLKIIALQITVAVLMGIITYTLDTLLPPTTTATAAIIFISGTFYTLTLLTTLRTFTPDYYTKLREKTI